MKGPAAFQHHAGNISAEAESPPAAESGSETDERKMERMLKNRLSAKRSREVAKNHVNLLEKNVAFLSRQAHVLAQRLAIVEAENARLRQHAHMNQSAAMLGCMHNHTKTASVHEPAALLSLQWIPLLLFLSTADIRPFTQGHRSKLTASNLRPETRLALGCAALRGSRRTSRSAPPQGSLAFCSRKMRTRRKRPTSLLFTLS